MIISHRHRFIYLKCRKVGSTSLEVALADLCGPDDVVTPLDGARTRADPDRRINWQNHVLPRERWPLAARLKVACGMTTRRAGVEFYNHIRADRLRRMVDPAVFDGYFKFAVERNPWDREVSNYFFQHPRADDRPPFAEFVRTHTARWPIDNFDIYTIGGRIVVDRVLRHETLEADFQAVMDRLGWLGLDWDREANAARGPLLSRPGSRVKAWVVPTDEELMIARHTLAAVRGRVAA